MHRVIAGLLLGSILVAFSVGRGEAVPTPTAAVGDCALVSGQIVMTGLGPCDIFYANLEELNEANLLEDILNETGQAWRDFHIEIGLGLGTGFLHSPTFFFEEASSTSGHFVLVSQSPAVNPNTLDFLAAGPDVAPGTLVSFDLEVYLSGIIVVGEPFTIRHLATVPGPASLILLGMSLASLAGFASLHARRPR